MKILLVTGGNSSEREVSLNSAKNVEKVLLENEHQVDLFDLQKGYDPIIELAKDYDAIFPILHGEEGEGGKLHEFLSKLGKPIVGTRNFKGLQGAWYKIPFIKYCDENGVKTSPWKKITNEDDILNFGFPCVLKASNGGSSKEVAILNSSEDLESEGCLEILEMQDIFVEKFIKG